MFVTRVLTVKPRATEVVAMLLPTGLYALAVSFARP